VQSGKIDGWDEKEGAWEGNCEGTDDGRGDEVGLEDPLGCNDGDRKTDILIQVTLLSSMFTLRLS